MRLLFGLVGVLLLLLPLACAEDGTGPPLPAAINAVPTTDSAAVATAVSLAVQVTDGQGSGIGGVPVGWEPTGGGGTIHPDTSATNGQGIATAEWVLGTSTGEQTARARVAELSPVLFTVTARPGPVASIVLSPDSVRFSALADTVHLKGHAEDEHGNAIQDPSFEWMSADTALATVSGAGVVTAAANGRTSVIATVNTTADTSRVVVLQEVAKLAIAPATDTVDGLGSSVQFSASVTDRNDFDVEHADVAWRSSDTAVASVDDRGEATSRRRGTARIVATAGEATDTSKLVVVQSVASVTIQRDSVHLAALADTARLQATASDRNGHAVPEPDLAWESLDTAVATVDTAGVATARANGTAGVVARIDGRADTAVIVVDQEPANISIDPTLDTLHAVGDSLQLTAEVADATGHEIAEASLTWASLDTAVARVDPTGIVSAVADGTAPIVAASGEVEDTALVSVEQVVAGVVVSPDSLDVVMGDSAWLTATASDSNGVEVSAADFTWSSADTLVAPVDARGLVVGKAAGITRVTALETDGLADTAVVSVTGSWPEAVTVETESDAAVSAEIGPDGGTLTATAEDGTDYRLTIPAAALAAETTIRMTPLTDLVGLPPGGELISGVKLEPEGLRFPLQATLEMILPAAMDNAAGFAASDGADFRLEIADDTADTVRFALPHFSERGLTTGVAQHCRAFDGGTVGVEKQAKHRIRCAIHHGWSGDGLTTEAVAAVKANFESWFDDGVVPRFSEAIDCWSTSECASADSLSVAAVSRFTDWLARIQMLSGAFDGESLSVLETRGRELTANMLSSATRVILDTCLSSVVGEEREKHARRYVRYQVWLQSLPFPELDSLVSSTPLLDCGYIILDPVQDTILVGDSVNISATVANAVGDTVDGEPVTWSTNDEGVATVDAGGTVEGVAPGDAAITAHSDRKQATARVTVAPRVGTITGRFWVDVDDDSTFDSAVDEILAVEGWHVELQGYRGPEDPTTYDLIAVDSTDANGHYRFEDIAEGVYRISAPDVRDAEESSHLIWSALWADSIEVTAGSEKAVDFSARPFTRILGRVWVDDGDGEYTAESADSLLSTDSAAWPVSVWAFATDTATQKGNRIQDGQFTISLYRRAARGSYQVRCFYCELHFPPRWSSVADTIEIPRRGDYEVNFYVDHLPEAVVLEDFPGLDERAPYYAYDVNASGQVLGGHDYFYNPRMPGIWTTADGWQPIDRGMDCKVADNMNGAGVVTGVCDGAAAVWSATGAVTIIDDTLVIPQAGPGGLVGRGAAGRQRTHNDDSYECYVTKGDAINDGGAVFAVNQRKVSECYGHLVYSWTASGGLRIAGELPSEDARRAEVLALNNNNVAVGRYQIRVGSERLSTAFKVRDTIGVELLPHLPGGTESEAHDINDDGYAVGWSRRGDGIRRAVIWTPSGEVVDLGSLGGPDGESAAYGINDHGQIVGESEGEELDCAGHVLKPVLWTESSGIVRLPITEEEHGTRCRLGPAGGIGLEITDEGLVVGLRYLGVDGVYKRHAVLWRELWP